VCATSAESEFDELARRLADAGSLVVVTHERPDGDALGSAMALVRAARAAGKKADFILPEPVPRQYAFLFADEAPLPGGQFDELADGADAVVVVDTCAFGQLAALAEGLRKRRAKTLVIDHHLTRDAVGAVEWTDTTAAAVGVMVLELLGALAWRIDGRTAEALATAIVSDTGWLRFSNTDARCLRALARLVEMGVRGDELYCRLHQSDRPHRLRLLERMLASIELRCDDRLAVMCLLADDFRQSGAHYDETENLINEALRVETVEAVALLVENADCIRASLRSRRFVDVAAVAERFGGGGHARAAGFRCEQPIAEVKSRVTAAIGEALEAESPD